MKKYRVLVDIIEHGYVDVEANDKQEATDKAEDEINNGGFVGNNSDVELLEVIEN